MCVQVCEKLRGGVCALCVSLQRVCVHLSEFARVCVQISESGPSYSHESRLNPHLAKENAKSLPAGSRV